MDKRKRLTELEAADKRIRQDNPTASRNVTEAVSTVIEQLATSPRPWPTGEVEETRELVDPRYACSAPGRCSADALQLQDYGATSMHLDSRT